MTNLTNEIKALIISALNLEDLTADDIEDDMALFDSEGLGLDSIDALELGLAIKKKYGITLSADDENTRAIFHSVATLAAYIQEHRVAR